MQVPPLAIPPPPYRPVSVDVQGIGGKHPLIAQGAAVITGDAVVDANVFQRKIGSVKNRAALVGVAAGQRKAGKGDIDASQSIAAGTRYDNFMAMLDEFVRRRDTL